MRVLFLDTYYPRFLSALYEKEQGLAARPFTEQRQRLLEQVFGTSDFYSRHFQTLGYEAQDLIVNCKPLQRAWARENRTPYSELALRLPSRLLRLPGIGPWLSALPGLVEIAVEQIKATRPDVLYCQDLWFLPPQKLAELRPYARLIVGQIASPLPPKPYLHGFDLITTSFPHFVPRLRAMGIASEYFRIGFDTRVLELLGSVAPDIDASFVGGISRHHGKALPMLESLARTTPIQFFGYGAGSLSRQSPIVARHRGEVWGLDMYHALARSRVTLNRHINVAENFANNMRLYEATGVGSLLITDRKDNLDELFEIGKEVVAYDSPEEAAELIRHYIAHPQEAQAIAKAGQARTLREHTYKHRMEELAPMLERYLGGRST
ncbi:glycosyltransferase [Hydrogenophaga sp.]|uniref:CgeB family protein n=1 Tax=Hydrogenophaga sp. TaxID=1904254 RepID=UPI00271E4633|nr:glycosyltransferase [Hydrogenophaga sp.]MDO9438430.1 glycosyltransferase [Hydrogenophaga sp.]